MILGFFRTVSQCFFRTVSLILFLLAPTTPFLLYGERMLLSLCAYVVEDRSGPQIQLTTCTMKLTCANCSLFQPDLLKWDAANIRSMCTILSILEESWDKNTGNISTLATRI